MYIYLIVLTSVSWTWNHARDVVVYITTLDHVQGHVYAERPRAQKMVTAFVWDMYASGKFPDQPLYMERLLRTFHGTRTRTRTHRHGDSTTLCRRRDNLLRIRTRTRIPTKGDTGLGWPESLIGRKRTEENVYCSEYICWSQGHGWKTWLL